MMVLYPLINNHILYSLINSHRPHQKRNSEIRTLMQFPNKATKMIKSLKNEIYGEWPEEQFYIDNFTKTILQTEKAEG